MATITVGPNSSLRPWRGGRAHEVMQMLESATQTFAVNDLLTYDTTSLKENKVIKATTADPCTTNPIIGSAAEAATGTEGTQGQVSAAGYVQVYPAEEQTEWIGHVKNTVALTAAMVGLSCGVVWDSTNKIWRVATADTTQTRVRITELVDNVGDVNGRVLFKWLNATRSPLAQ